MHRQLSQNINKIFKYWLVFFFVVLFLFIMIITLENCSRFHKADFLYETNLTHSIKHKYHCLLCIYIVWNSSKQSLFTHYNLELPSTFDLNIGTHYYYYTEHLLQSLYVHIGLLHGSYNQRKWPVSGQSLKQR